MPVERKTEIENMWVEKPRLDDGLPAHVIARIIFEISMPTILNKEKTRLTFKIHGVISEYAKPPYVVYEKTMSMGGVPIPLFQPDEVFRDLLDEHARIAIKRVIEKNGKFNIGTRYRVEKGGKVIRESRPGV